eukprot:7391448-Prymnesium_polylepis.3
MRCSRLLVRAVGAGRMVRLNSAECSWRLPHRCNGGSGLSACEHTLNAVSVRLGSDACRPHRATRLSHPTAVRPRSIRVFHDTASPEPRFCMDRWPNS